MTRLRILDALRVLVGGLLLAGGFIALLWVADLVEVTR